jgi:hypothetical protein
MTPPKTATPDPCLRHGLPRPCPSCRALRAERALRRLLASQGVREAKDAETCSAAVAARSVLERGLS